MAQQQARDEAGNIWNVDEAGNVISLASPAPQNGASVVASNPVQAARQSVDLGGAQLGNQRTAQQIAIEAAKAPFAPRQAAAETSKAEADAAAAALTLQKAQREAALPVSGQVGRQNLQRAIDDIKRAFAAGPGQTSGIAGLADYLPTTENQQFDAAGNSVRGFVGPALGLTGGQLNTEKEAQRAVGPYIPQSGDRDAVILDKIRRLQGLADAMGGTRRSQQSGDQQAIDAATVGGGNGPAGYDVAGVGGVAPGSGGGDGGSFIDAAGIKMAQRMSQAYNRGASASDINKLLRDNGYQELGADGVRAIEKRGPINFAPPAVDDTRGSVGRALGDVASSPLGAYAISAGDAVTAGTLDNIAGGQAGLAMDYAREQNPTASLLGSITGGALAAGGAEIGLGAAGLSAGRAALAGDALYGAAYGAGSADDGQSRLGGAVLGGALGVGGGVAGRAAARGIGGTLTGVQNANVQGLRAAGVPLTAGQATGGVLKGVEDRLSGLPMIGDAVNARRLEGMQGFNRAAFNEALAPIGANTGGVTGEAGIDAAQAATRQGYDTALNGVSVTRDPQFTADYNGAINQGAGVPRVGPEFEAWARSDLDPLTAQPTFDGATVQDFIQQTRGADFGNDAMGNLVGRSVTGAEDAMRGLVNRQAPDVLPALGRADQAYRGTQVLKDAVNRARNGTRVGETGTFAPSQLSDAAAANAKRFGNSQGTTRQPFFNLTRAGQDVLPNSVPDSGTAGRAIVAGGLGLAGLGGGAGYATGEGEGAGYGAGAGLATAALLAAGGSRAGQNLLVRGLLDRPQVAINLGRRVGNRAIRGGIFGAPLLAGTTPVLLPAQ